jgi:hypothetical protein
MAVRLIKFAILAVNITKQNFVMDIDVAGSHRHSAAVRTPNETHGLEPN